MPKLGLFVAGLLLAPALIILTLVLTPRRSERVLTDFTLPSAAQEISAIESHDFEGTKHEMAWRSFSLNDAMTYADAEEYSRRACQDHGFEVSDEPTTHMEGETLVCRESKSADIRFTVAPCANTQCEVFTRVRSMW